MDFEMNPSCATQEHSPYLKWKFHFHVDLAFPVISSVWETGNMINDSIFGKKGIDVLVLNMVVSNSKSDVCLWYLPHY